MTEVTFCAYDKPDSVGGPLTWLVNLLPALREHGIESRCLFLTHWGDTGPFLAKLRAEGFECAQAACHEHSRDRIKWILSQLQQNPPDIFVPNLVVAGYFAGRWVRKAGIPTVGILHSDDPFYRGIQDEFVFGREAYRVSALACVSSELERQVLDRQPPATSVHRIPYGVSVPAKKRKRTPGKLRLAFVGRLAEEQKQISLVSRALCEVTKRVSGTEAVLYGDGPDRDNVERILDGEGQGLPVALGGLIPHEQMQDRLLECDVLVLLSDYEGLPIAVLEAMACGVVPVCLRMRSGIPELVEDGVTGLLVNDRKEGFVNAIERLQNEPSLWARLSQVARERITSEYTHQVCAEHWADMFHRLNAPADTTRTIVIPRKLRLPPTNPALASADPRPAITPFPIRLYLRGRMVAGRIKRHLIGQPSS
jgi:glycosyltransferase involved in cell wall biosynthesis